MINALIIQSKTKRLGGRAVRKVRVQSVPSREETNQQINFGGIRKAGEDVRCHNLFPCFHPRCEAACRDPADPLRQGHFTFHFDTIYNENARQKGTFNAVKYDFFHI